MNRRAWLLAATLSAAAVVAIFVWVLYDLRDCDSTANLLYIPEAGLQMELPPPLADCGIAFTSTYRICNPANPASGENKDGERFVLTVLSSEMAEAFGFGGGDLADAQMMDGYLQSCLRKFTPSQLDPVVDQTRVSIEGASGLVTRVQCAGGHSSQVMLAIKLSDGRVIALVADRAFGSDAQHQQSSLLAGLVDGLSFSNIDEAKVTPTSTSDIRSPFPPLNEGEGDCHDPVFELVDFPTPDRIFHTDETMSATVDYDAPGCAELRGTFGVRHVEGSPRFEFYCRQDDGTIPAHCEDGFDGNIPVSDILITSTSGRVTITAKPDEFPPVNLESAPDLEGAQVCSIILSVNDGVDGGSKSHQQIDVGCARN